jgi:hypothetical protein
MGSVGVVAGGRQATRAWPEGMRHWGAARQAGRGLGSSGGDGQLGDVYVPARKQKRESIKTENRM